MPQKIRTSVSASSGTDRQRIRWLAALALLLALIAITWWARTDAVPDQPPVDEAQRVAAAFLAQLAAGQAAMAWDSATTELKNAQGREKFERYVNQFEILKRPLSLVSLQVVTVQDQPRTECLFQAATGSQSVRLLVGQEGKLWKVDRLLVDGEMETP